MLAIATKIYSRIPPIRRPREKPGSSARSSVLPEDRHVSTTCEASSALKLVISITNETQLAALTAARMIYNAEVSAGGSSQAGRAGNGALKAFDSNEDYITFLVDNALALFVRQYSQYQAESIT